MVGNSIFFYSVTSVPPLTLAAGGKLAEAMQAPVSVLDLDVLAETLAELLYVHEYLALTATQTPPAAFAMHRRDILCSFHAVTRRLNDDAAEEEEMRLLGDFLRSVDQEAAPTND